MTCKIRHVTHSFITVDGNPSGTDVKPAFRHDTSLSRSQWQLLTHGTGFASISSVDDGNGLNDDGKDDVTAMRQRKTRQPVFFISKRRR